MDSPSYHVREKVGVSGPRKRRRGPDRQRDRGGDKASSDLSVSCSEDLPVGGSYISQSEFGFLASWDGRRYLDCGPVVTPSFPDPTDVPLGYHVLAER